MSDLGAFFTEFSAPVLPSVVRAKREIADSPLARRDSSARRGAVGTVEDYGEEYWMVDFGRGAVLCYPNEVEAVR